MWNRHVWKHDRGGVAVGGGEGREGDGCDVAEVIKLCSIVTEQAKTIERLESELNNVRAQLQARMVAPVPTLRRVLDDVPRSRAHRQSLQEGQATVRVLDLACIVSIIHTLY